jgi:hypothetical protein
MRKVVVLLLIAASGWAADPVPYSAEEVAQYVDTFHTLLGLPKVPPEDPLAILEDLERAHRYWDEKDGHERVQHSIVKALTAGLATARRPVVLGCARALGRIGTAACDESLRAWLTLLLAQRTPDPQLVEAGFQGLARTGTGEGIDFLSRSARLEGPLVAAPALRALRDFRRIPGARRRTLFAELLRDLPADAEKTRRVECLRTLGALADREFETVAAAREWWETQPWPDYVGPRYRETPVR